MEAVQTKKAWKAVKFHAKIAWRGFCRTIYGAAIMTFIKFSVLWFSSVKEQTGWLAVLLFICALIALFVSVANVYIIGISWNKRS